MKHWMERACRLLVVVPALPLVVSCTSHASNASGSGQPDVAVEPPAATAPGERTPTLPPPPETPGRQLGQNTPASDRLSAQMPVIDPFIEVVGTSAVEYFTDVARQLPQLPAFADLASAAVCGSRHGPVAAKAYVSPDLTQAAGIVDLSESTANPHSRGVPLACLAGHAPMGPRIMRVDDGPAQPCAMKYYFDSREDGAPVRHFVLVAGTSTGMCELLLSRQASYKPQPFDVA